MKNLIVKVTGLLFISLLLMMACTKEDRLLVDDNTLLYEADDRFAKPSQTVTVLPTGENDTENLMDALRNAPAGSVVRLVAATYFIEPILVEGFNGILKGAGMNNTFIRPYGALNFPDQDFYDYPSMDNMWPFLISFNGGDFQMQDMTLQIPEGTPVSWTLTLNPSAPLPLDALGGLLLITGETANSTVRRVAFEGAPGNFLGYNLINGYYLQGPLGDPFLVSGSHALYGSRFQYMGWGASLGSFGEAELMIGGNAANGNTFQDVNVGIETYDFADAQVEVSFNTVTNPNFYGISALQGLYGIPEVVSDIIIRKNNITVSGNADGAFFNDLGVIQQGEKKMNLLFEKNKIHQTNNNYGGVFGIGLQDAVIEQNQFWGDGEYGVFLNRAYSCMMIKNILPLFEPGIADFMLLPFTQYNTITGSVGETTVLDLGVDNNVESGTLLSTPATSDSEHDLRYRQDSTHPWKAIREARQ